MGGDYAMNNFSCLTKIVKEKYINLRIGQNSSCDILPFISCIINGQGSTVSLKLKFLANFDGTFLLLMLTFIQVVGKLSHLHWAKVCTKAFLDPADMYSKGTNTLSSIYILSVIRQKGESQNEG